MKVSKFPDNVDALFMDVKRLPGFNGLPIVGK